MERIIKEIRNNRPKQKLKSSQQNVRIFTQGKETGYQGKTSIRLQERKQNAKCI